MGYVAPTPSAAAHRVARLSRRVPPRSPPRTGRIAFRAILGAVARELRTGEPYGSPVAPSPTAHQSDRVGLFRGLGQHERIQLHARLVYPRHRGIGLQVALVEYRVEHLRHETAIGHRDFVAETVFPVLSFLREKRFHHLEAVGDPVPVPGVHALL